MIFFAFFLHLLLFGSLLYLTNFKKNYFNPVYFLMYANYFYFFIIWILWYFVDKNYIFKYQYGYYLTLLHGIGLIIGVLYAQKLNKKLIINISKLLIKSKFEYISAKSLFYTFIFFSVIIIYITYDIYQTLNPIEILVKIEATKQLGIQYKSGLSYFIKPIQTLLILIFCFLIYRSFLERKVKYIVYSLIIYVLMALALGSKSMVVFPLFYIFIIKHNFFKKVSLKNIVIVGVLVLLFIPFLELVRQGLTYRIDENGFASIIHTLVGRINMQLYLTKFYEHGFYNIDYPNSLYHFFTYFIPRSLLENIGIVDKPIPFGLAYTRYVTDRPEVYMTVAGGGIAEWIHNFSIFDNIYIIYFSIVLGGFISGFVMGILYRITQLNNVSKFIIILIFIHIGTFFEFGFSVTIGTFETIFTLIFLIIATNLFIWKKRGLHKA